MTTMTDLIASTHHTNRITMLLSALVALWFFAALGLSLAGAIDVAHGGSPVLLPAAVVLPLVLFAMAYRFGEGFRQFVLNIDMRALILLHAMRTMGLGFVFLYVFDVLPAVFALPAGLGDAITAWSALILGIALYRGLAVSKRTVWLWNSFGLLDFIVALIVGTLVRSVPFGLLTGDVTTNPMGAFPLSLFPTFLVPLFMITHFIVYAQLRNRWGKHARVQYR